MDLKQLRCAVAAADEMHFSRAAQALEMTAAAFGRHVRTLEDELGVQLFARTTRSVALTEEGREFVAEARRLLAGADALAERVRTRSRSRARVIRLGAIDSAAAGLVPSLLHDFRRLEPAVTVQLVEDKSIRLIPKLLSGRIDVAILRPPTRVDPRLTLQVKMSETAVVALPAAHPLSAHNSVAVADLADVAMIIPERRSRPHSHDLTIKLFEEAGLRPRIGQIADEKQTILTMVAAGIGAAIVPLWATRLAVQGVAFRTLAGDGAGAERLPLAVAWHARVRDADRDRLLELLDLNLARYARQDLA